MKVLFVDDEPSFSEQAKLFLEKIDSQITILPVNSAKKALKRLNNSRFDVIVSDYQMPGMNGLEFLEIIREKRNSDIPFIIFTGRGREEVAMKALNLGADRYFQKKGNPKTQYEILAQAIKQEYNNWQSKKKLKKTEKIQSIILEQTSDYIAFHNPEHNLIWANNSYQNALEMDLEELKGQKCFEAWYGRKKPCKGCPTEKALKSGKIEKGEISPTEGDKNWLITAIPLKDNEGNIEKVIESALDITKLKEKRKKLKKYERMVEEANDYIYIIDFEGTIHFVNQAGEIGLGYDKGELKGKDVFKLVHPEDRDWVKQKFQEFVNFKTKNLEEKVELRWKKSDGSYIWKEASGTILPDSDNILVTSRNITKCKKNQEKLKKISAEYKTIFQNIQNNIFLVDIKNDQFIIQRLNPHHEETTGIKNKEIIGKTPTKALGEMGKKLEKKYRECVEKKSPITYEEQHDLPTGKKTLITKLSPVIIEDEVKKIVGTSLDITKRKKMEKHKELLHSLLKHDIRNNTQTIAGYLELLNNCEIPQKPNKYLEKAKKAVKDSLELINKIETLETIKIEEKIQKTNINPILKNIINKMEQKAQNKGIKIEYTEKNIQVLGGPLLKELFSNIIENAIQHSQANKIQIKSQKTENHCIITIEDNGKGIPDKQKNKITQKGYKTGQNAGTGIGLYITKKITEKYKGKLKIKNSNTGGTKFKTILKKPKNNPTNRTIKNQ
ncbi:PAS domain S-box protein [Methanonatronarchaeum sp. AMET-Sl]|uniref:PAS domain S-box protein n=1 Tax=Methanonatronarchaeum sp. AMET-Sl TaxID=3037654 RepID=UPI00244E51BB|nr:PAS domain S-box protein [Methanonatronarchaeum sp. AMET-Sl]WGI17965.1 PAS domain S-box protein [Methanonatronarchaeum sp. AMET-Sl]